FFFSPPAPLVTRPRLSSSSGTTPDINRRKKNSSSRCIESSSRCSSRVRVLGRCCGCGVGLGAGFPFAFACATAFCFAASSARLFSSASFFNCCSRGRNVGVACGFGDDGCAGFFLDTPLPVVASILHRPQRDAHGLNPREHAVLVLPIGIVEVREIVWISNVLVRQPGTQAARELDDLLRLHRLDGVDLV